jgi:hypothetical protein
VKLVELLLLNRHLWWNRVDDKKRRPILMVCYTNHALDQFLEYCVRECGLKNGVVRIGSRCENENIQPFLLSNIKRNKSVMNGANNKQLIQEQRQKFKDLETRVKKLNDLINATTCHYENLNGLVSFKALKDYMRKEHFDQLTNCNREFENVSEKSSDDFTLIEWLGLCDLDFHDPKFNKFEIQAEENIKEAEQKVKLENELKNGKYNFNVKFLKISSEKIG